MKIKAHIRHLFPLLETCFLAHLIVRDFNDDFKNFEILMKWKPNLKSLTIKSNENDKIIDAPR
jgi:hypothetical protein